MFKVLKMESKIRDKYTAVIGLEVHAQLSTQSKIFAPDSTRFGALPNSSISVITLGHPGTLPKLNKKVVELAIKMGIACHCEITRETIFDRKNYFYPDLPKGYQITQDRAPICRGGFVTIRMKEGETKNVHLTKIHMEEDAGKSIHLPEERDTLVDLNRAGIPLIEIVTQPDLRTSEEAGAFLAEVRKIVRYLDICDGNMEEGSLRCDANISVMLKDSPVFGNKVEVKNMNSIRNVQRAIDHEIERQIIKAEAGELIVSETRLFDAASGTTASMRTKETLTDYRYFPEPDLSPLIISEEWMNQIKASMTELPGQLYEEFVEKYNLPHYDAIILTENRDFAHYFRKIAQHTQNYKSASNWMMISVKAWLNDTGKPISEFPIKPEQIAGLIDLIDKGTISHTAASQQVFPELIRNVHQTPVQVAETLNLLREDDLSKLNEAIDKTLKKLPEKVSEYRKGKKGLIGMFMGEVMKLSQGKADPKVASRLLKERLEKQ
jgi:aspartyl-tRNA(Asn)/glutamyl-tRNA(Gln) amidotransferase subunit B